MKKTLGRPKKENVELKTLRWSTLIKPSVGNVIDAMEGSRADNIEKLLNEHLNKSDWDPQG
jgi:hypothetical protein